MKLILIAVLLTILTVSSVSAEELIPDRYNVIMKDRFNPSWLKATLGLDPDINYKTFKGFTGNFTDDQIDKLKKNHSTVSVEPDGIMTIDAKEETSFDVLRHNGDKNQIVISGLKINGTLGVVDTGINLHSKDFNVVGCITTVPNTKDCSDDNGHGSFVSSKACGKGKKILGIAPGCDIFAIKGLNQDGSGFTSNIALGVEQAIEEGVTVFNFSFGSRGGDGDCNSNILHKIMCEGVDAGIIFVCAAGNNKQPVSWHVPAAYPECFSVEAIASDGKIGFSGQRIECRPIERDEFQARFTNYGGDIAAVGVCNYGLSNTGKVNQGSGTSFAAPIVAGAFMLLNCDSTNRTETFQCYDLLKEHAWEINSLEGYGVWFDQPTTAKLLDIEFIGTNQRPEFHERVDLRQKINITDYSPKTGEIISGKIKIWVTTDCDSCVDWVTFSIPRNIIDGKSPFSINFDTTDRFDGDHFIRIAVVGKAGYVGDHVGITPIIDNDKRVGDF